MRTLFIFFFCIFSFSLFAQTKTISGTIRDANTNETLIGLSIIAENYKIGTTTNDYGYFSLQIPEEVTQISISYLGYNKQIIEISGKNLANIQILMTTSSEDLEEVVISANSIKDIQTPEMSVNQLNIQTIKQMPVVFGEVDIIRSLLLLPGVSNAGEASSGFNVRGGAVDQNLILLDEATIYNSSHLFGLFSVFNPDAVKNLKLYKGGIPAEFGGRVSSVLEIYQKNGNSREFHANGGLGIISSRLLAEGPIQKDKSSFLIGARSSYAHLFLKLIDNPNSAYFYDLNTKLNYRVDDENELFLSGYFGRDVFNISESFENTYGNAVINLRWNRIISDNIFTNLSVIYSDYFYGLDLNFVEFNWNSGIKNFNVKYDVAQNINENLNLKFGANSIYYQFNAGEIVPTTETSGINRRNLIKKYALENAIYFSAEQSFSENISAEYGFRISNFLRLGQESLNLYESGQPVIYNPDFGIYTEAEPVATKTLEKSKLEKAFVNLEPRLAISFKLSEEQSLKFSYNRINQYLHLISNTSSPTPLDVWAPSGKYIEPQKGDQIAVGYYQNLVDSKFTLESEAYYKTVKNRLDYIDGANLIANDAIEQVLLNGQSRSYGAEFLFRKNSGKLTGWLAYTISVSEQQTPGGKAGGPGINRGNWYRTPYDKTHDLSITSSYSWTDKWKFNANFIYQTGLPSTFPTGKYSYESLTIPVYGDRNSSRLPDYHRLDISATLIPKNQSDKKLKSSWNFGIYNVYNRRNAQSISFQKNEDSGKNEAVRLSLFGIIPSVTYNFSF